MYNALGPSNWPKNHNRRCANDNPTRSGRTPARNTNRAPPTPGPDNQPATPATDDTSNNTLNGNSTPNTDR
ncbi:hypothetical protein ACWCPF_45465, partial [Streptomyces sp. NPDC001858]